MKKFLFIYLILCLPLCAQVITVTPEYEQRYQDLLGQLRCLVCQNQSVADSPSDLALDFRIEVKEMLEQGKSNQEILDFMSDRYGDFVLYDPPIAPRTWLLWVGPFLFLIGGVVAALAIVRKRTVDIQSDPLNESDKKRLHDLLENSKD